MGEILTLQGVAISKYHTIGAFAEAMHWSRNKASRIINGVQAPTVDEIQEIAELLHINSQETFMQIFLPKFSTKLTSNKMA